MLLRKLLHISTIIIPVWLKYIEGTYHTKTPGMIVLISLTILAFVIEILRNLNPAFGKFFTKKLDKLLKDDEKRGKPTGASFLILSMTLTYLLFDFHIFYYASIIAILVDGITPVINSLVFKKSSKDHSHLIIFIISAVIVAFVINSGLPLQIKLASSIIVSIIEYINPPPDDNIYAELIGAFIIFILLEIFVH